MAGEDDFEEELLLVAGRSKSAGKKRGRQASESDDEGGPVEVDHGNKERGGGKGRSKKASRRSTDDHDESDSGGADDDEEEEEERAKMAKMTELEREMYLFEREEKREREKQRMQVMDQARKADQAVELRASSRRARTQTHADNAIGKLAAARQKREARAKQREQEQVEEERRRGRDEDSEEESEEPAEEDEEAEAEELEEELEEEEEELEEAGADDVGYVRSGDAYSGPGGGFEEEEAGDEAEPADLPDLLTIQLTRDMLEDWHDKPFFTSAVKGCVVRMVLGEVTTPTGHRVPDAHLFKVLDVQQRNSYGFGKKEGMRTDRWLRLDDAGHSKTMQMRCISNQELQQDEYDRYRRHCTKNNFPEITKGDVERCRQELAKAREYKYSAEDIKARLSERRAKGHLLGSVAQERLRLREQIELARQEGDEDKAEQLQQELEDLNRKAASKEGDMGAAMANINKRNRDINNKKSFGGVSNRPAGAGYDKSTVDVFSRRQTQSRVYWKTGNAEEDGSAAAGAAAAAAQQAAAAGQLRRTSSGAADTRKVQAHQQKMDPMDLIKELPFDVDLGKLRLQQGANLPRKVLGPRYRCLDVSTDLTGKNTLTYGDWKRRMALNIDHR